MLGLNGVGMILMRGHASLEVQLTFALVAIAAGAVGDFLVSRLRPSPDRVIALRAFAFLLPAAYFAIYLGVVVWRVGSGWTVHELTGIVTMAGIVGLLTSFVFAADGGILPTFVRLARFAPVTPIVGSGRQRIQPIWVDDVAAYFARAVDLPEAAGGRTCCRRSGAWRRCRRNGFKSRSMSRLATRIHGASNTRSSITACMPSARRRAGNMFVM